MGTGFFTAVDVFPVELFAYQVSIVCVAKRKIVFFKFYFEIHTKIQGDQHR